MCMNEFVKKLYDFRGIYKKKNGVIITIGLLKNHCDLIPTAGFDLSQNSQYIKPRKNSIFLKNGKTVILVGNHKFSRSPMTKRPSPLNSSHEI